MGIPARHSSAPYVDDETLAGADLETDIANAYAEIGNIENANVASGANIDGSKLAATSIAASKITTSTLTTTQFAQSAVPQAYVSRATATGAMTTSTDWQNVDDITQASIAPSAVGDMIFCDFTVAFVSGAGIGEQAEYQFGFSVDGTDTNVLGTKWLDNNVDPESVHISYAVAATATSTHVIKPRYRAVLTNNDGSYVADHERVFRVLVIPQK